MRVHVRVTLDVLVAGSLESWKLGEPPGYSDRTAISRTVHIYYISLIIVWVIGKQPQLIPGL